MIIITELNRLLLHRVCNQSIRSSRASKESFRTEETVDLNKQNLQIQTLSLAIIHHPL